MQETILSKCLDFLFGLSGKKRVVKATLHKAYFTYTAPEKIYGYFITVTNLSQRAVEITHVWMDVEGADYYAEPYERPLPKRLEPDESWATWILVEDLPEEAHRDYQYRGRVRLSTDKVIRTRERRNIPGHGSVPGGPLRKEYARKRPGEETLSALSAVTHEGDQVINRSIKQTQSDENSRGEGLLLGLTGEDQTLLDELLVAELKEGKNTTIDVTIDQAKSAEFLHETGYVSYLQASNNLRKIRFLPRGLVLTWGSQNMEALEKLRLDIQKALSSIDGIERAGKIFEQTEAPEAVAYAYLQILEQKYYLTIDSQYPVAWANIRKISQSYLRENPSIEQLLA